jgi:hypothetical protein
VKKETLRQNLLLWSVADVATYISAAGFPEQAVAFRTQVSAVPQTATWGWYLYTQKTAQTESLSRDSLYLARDSPQALLEM